MYHCHFTGRRRELFQHIRQRRPPEGFSCEFSESGMPEGDSIRHADVIFANLQGMDGEATLQMLLRNRKKESQIILLMEPGQLRFSEKELNEVADIWMLPMTDEEIRFRFLRWQTSCTAARDSRIRLTYREQLFDIFFTYLAKNMDDVYIILNEDCHTAEYIGLNIERVLGISPEELKNDPALLGDAKYLAGTKLGCSDLKAMTPGVESAVVETERLNRKTGERKYFHETVYCVRIQEANKFIIHISDRTKERQTQDVLTEALELAKEASKTKSAFLSNVSHDIRTPMNVIMGLIALLKEESAHPDRVLEYTQKISAASQHLLDLINDVLDMNKIESGNTLLDVSDLDLAEVINDLNTVIRPQARAKNQTFDISTSGLTNEHLLGDKLRINQILVNILTNAVKYTQEGGRILLQMEELPQIDEKYACIQFTISDNGRGMSKDYQKLIFKPFTRELESSLNQIEGTGLGMAITKSLVDLMNGSIRLESEPDKGSTFTVRLELRIREEDKEAPEFWKKNGFFRMLTVDANEEICRNIIRAMSGTCVTAEFATDGRTAMDLISRAHENGEAFDLILLDWDTPGLNCIEADRMIKNTHADKMPVVLFTAYDWQEIEAKAPEIGIDHFLPKPFFMSNFRNSVEQIMGKALKTASAASGSGSVNGMKILVVDDIDINRMILVKILEKLGASTDTAVNGQDAVDKFEDSQPGDIDLILMDIQMPIMNGYEATRVIRASSHPSAKKIAIIAMTANAFIDDVHDALEAGMDAHIAKPVVVDHLKSTIKEVMRVKAEMH